jgi:GDPmannose 4,6-dehydratase
VREFAEKAFAHVGREIVWWGEGVEEEGRDRKTGKDLIRIDPKYFRPTEVEQLQGDARKAHRALGWQPQTSFDDLIHEMVESDLLVVGREHQVYPVISNDGLVSGVSAFRQERATMA